jgi:hypothetical protein
LRRYDKAEFNGKLKPKDAPPATGVWTADITDGFSTDTTDFRDFPGFKTPGRFVRGDSIVLDRTYLVLIVCVSKTDPTKVLDKPLAVMGYSVNIDFNDDVEGATQVRFGSRGDWSNLPNNWAKLLGLTPVAKF